MSEEHSMASCNRCAGTGIVKASLVKNAETNNNEFIDVVLCSEYSDNTDKNLAALSAGGLEVRVVGKANESDYATSEEQS
jgi:hypothetical protein